MEACELPGTGLQGSVGHMLPFRCFPPIRALMPFHMTDLQIYFTRVIVYLLKSSLLYEYTWIGEGADQIASLLFYIWTATKFRPHDANPYLKLSTAGEEDVEMT